MSTSRFSSPSPRLWCCLVLILISFALLASVPASAVSGAGFTTFADPAQPTNPTGGATGGCLDSPNGVDCNNYSAKEDVYISGGPIAGSLGAGCYYFDVLVPGFQNGGFVDGQPGNLSDTTQSLDNKAGTITGAGSGDSSSNRTFRVLNTGAIVYPDTTCDAGSGGHTTGIQPNTGKTIIQMMPYDDTTNPGGVYIAAVCQVGATQPSQCKFDAFRIKATTTCTGPDCSGQPTQGTVSVCKFWDQNFDHVWDNNEPFIGAWPIMATISGGNGATLEGTGTQDTDNTVVDGSPGFGFGCTTFTVDFPAGTDASAVATVALSEGSAPDGSASPASQSCDIADGTCQATPNTTWVQTAPFVNQTSVTSENVSVSPSQAVQADNFGNDTGLPLTTSKDVNGSYKTTYGWSIQKDVTKCTTSSGVACDSATEAHQVGGTVTFTYKVTVTHDSGTNSAIKVTGTITVNNPNLDASNKVVPVSITGISDQLSDGTVCAVTGGGAQSLTKASTTFSYECDISGATVPTSDTNTVTVSWNTQTLSNGGTLAGGTATFTSDVISFTQTLVDDSVTVTDTLNSCVAQLGTVTLTTTTLGTGGCSIGNLSTPSYGVFTYTRTVNVPSFACTEYDNTATFTTDTSGTTGSSNAAVTVCGPARTGALTMGFWQNKNGQGIILNYSGASCQSLKTWLSAFHPFSDLTATSCGSSPSLGAKSASGVVGYVYNVIKAATCSGPSTSPCNAMLKAQTLATALDVYFSDGIALGGNRIGAPAAIAAAGGIGSVSIDLTQVCNMIDGSGGSASCSGSYSNVSAEFNNQTCLTVLGMLQWQNTADPLADAGAVWYGNIKSQQVAAKNAFDAINNQVAFACGP